MNYKDLLKQDTGMKIGDTANAMTDKEFWKLIIAQAVTQTEWLKDVLSY